MFGKAKKQGWIPLWIFLILGLLCFIGYASSIDAPRQNAEAATREGSSGAASAQHQTAIPTNIPNQYDNLSLGVPCPADTIVNREG